MTSTTNQYRFGKKSVYDYRNRGAPSKKGAVRLNYTKQYNDADACKYMSPFDKTTNPPRNPVTLGNFITLNDISRGVATTSTSNARILVICPSVRGAICSAFWDSTGADTSLLSGDTNPLNHLTGLDQPTVCRPLRAGVRIRNITKQDNKEGLVYAFMTSSPLEFDWASAGVNMTITTAFFNEMVEMATGNSKSRSFTASELSMGDNEFVFYPCTSSAYNSYGSSTFNTASTITERQAGFNSTLTDMSLANLILYFPATSNANSYEISVCLQTAGRYPANTVLGKQQKPAIVGNALFTDMIHKAVQRSSTDTLDNIIRKSVPRPIARSSQQDERRPVAIAKARGRPRTSATAASSGGGIA